MDNQDIIIRRAEPGDLVFIMATERLPGYADLVGRWDQDAHCRALADERYAYFVAIAAEDANGVRDPARLEQPRAGHAHQADRGRRAG